LPLGISLRNGSCRLTSNEQPRPQKKTASTTITGHNSRFRVRSLADGNISAQNSFRIERSEQMKTAPSIPSGGIATQMKTAPSIPSGGHRDAITAAVQALCSSWKRTVNRGLESKMSCIASTVVIGSDSASIRQQTSLQESKLVS